MVVFLILVGLRHGFDLGDSMIGLIQCCSVLMVRLVTLFVAIFVTTGALLRRKVLQGALVFCASTHEASGAIRIFLRLLRARVRRAA